MPDSVPQNEDSAWVRVASIEEIRSKGVCVVTAGGSRVAVFADGDDVRAVDNRCPHMGFPLDQGTVANGILTCHWHQARFDLKSGCTFDLFADDAVAYDVVVKESVVYVADAPRHATDSEFHGRRLIRGLDQNVPLVQAKSLLGLLDIGDFDRIVREVGNYGTRHLSIFGEGLVRLACVANLRPFLSPETTYNALLYAVRTVAGEAAGSVPRRPRAALNSEEHDFETLRDWLHQWVKTRHLDAAERTLLTGARVLSAEQLNELLLGAAAERLYANTGHLFDHAYKLIELSEHLGEGGARALLPLMTPILTQVRGEEERTEWHHPIELVEPIRAIESELPEILARARVDEAWEDDGKLLEILLGDDPISILDQLRASLTRGAPPERLAARVAYAATLRLARFATSNEVTDWLTLQHTLNFASAVQQATARSASADVVRAIFHAAIAVYMGRYLNVPAARLPVERGDLSQYSEDPTELLAGLVEIFDQRSDIDDAADLVSRYLRLNHPIEKLIDTLTFATVREDIDFHCLQVLDAGVRQCAAHLGGPEVEHIMVGVVRCLAAHCPTRRAGQQTAKIALRLHRGDAVYQDEAGEGV